MARGGNYSRTDELVGSSQKDALDQMGRACRRHDTTWRRLVDDNSRPLFGFSHDQSTTIQVRRVLPRSSHHCSLFLPVNWVYLCLFEFVMNSPVFVLGGYKSVLFACLPSIVVSSSSPWVISGLFPLLFP
jgi:hypothetical protein